MRYARFTLLISVVALTLVVSCSKTDPMESGPDQAALKALLATEIPAYIQLRDLRVQASQNVGDKVEPLFKTRFSATIELAADTFLQSSLEEGAVIIVPHLKAGTRREMYGLANSKLSAGAWKTEFTLDANPIPSLGRPRDSFTGGTVVVRGSAEETAFREALIKRRGEEERQQLEAGQREVERIRAQSQIEADRLRAEAEAQAARQTVEDQLLAKKRQEDQQRAATAAVEAETLAEASLLALVTSGASIGGNVCCFGRDAIIFFESVDRASHSVRGHVTYRKDTYPSPTTFRFQGQWKGDTITATGTDTVQRAGKPDKVQDCTFTLTSRVSQQHGNSQLAGLLCGNRATFGKRR
jgi:hypothetical protein